MTLVGTFGKNPEENLGSNRNWNRIDEFLLAFICIGHQKNCHFEIWPRTSSRKKSTISYSCQTYYYTLKYKCGFKLFLWMKKHLGNVFYNYSVDFNWNLTENSHSCSNLPELTKWTFFSLFKPKLLCSSKVIGKTLTVHWPFPENSVKLVWERDFQGEFSVEVSCYYCTSLESVRNPLNSQ